MSDWSVQKARETYSVGHWSNGYFDIAENGHVVARPRRHGEARIDLHELTEELQQSGLSLPVLVRFTDILHERVNDLCQAFNDAMDSMQYRGGYCAVYPIKVNQQYKVVESILDANHHQVGLEAGSKPELMIILALAGLQSTTLICNGYKDREYVRLALIGSELGHDITIVIEKPNELTLVIEEARALGIRPKIGLRARLASVGQGKWQNTGGEKSKFGLSSAQVLQVIERLREADMLECLQLLHVHLGSQVANIRDIRRAMQEAVRYYVELCRSGVPLTDIDVGGGLGIDYEGTRSRSYCSMNYTLAEYALNVVRVLSAACAEYQLPEPRIITESGRAMTAHHAVLITNVIDIETVPDGEPPAPRADEPVVIREMREGLDNPDQRPALEVYHDAVHGLAQAQDLYVNGILSLDDRALAEQIYFTTCRRVHARMQVSSTRHHDVLNQLHEKLADKVFCNFSVFQSIPDVWAIRQIFPIVPLQQLDEAPTRRGVLVDITCDSDGRIDAYVDNEGLEATLPVHQIDLRTPYLFGIFLVGAYQEILGDMHNLFGDTNSVNIEVDDSGAYRIVEPKHGDTVDDVLAYVNFDSASLLARYRDKISEAKLDTDLRQQFLDELEAGLTGYTYLED